MDILKVLKDANETIGCRTSITFELVETPCEHLRIRLRTKDPSLGYEEGVPLRELQDPFWDELLYRINQSARYLRQLMASQGVLGEPAARGRTTP